MLKRTFLHLPRVGETTERKIWNLGVHSWHDFLAAHGAGAFRGRRIERLSGDVTESIGRYERGDWNYFDQRVPSAHKWRAFGDLGDRVLYVDIETTGLMGDDPITVIGTYDGSDVKSFVAGRNLEAAQAEIEKHPLIVTFNGAQFDMPIIRSRFRYNFFNHVHIDLRFPLKRLGLTGGLKRIEETLGIQRSPRTRGLDGWDAVRLWNEYQDGSEAALELLLEYNREDIKNLQPLMRLVHGELTKQLSF